MLADADTALSQATKDVLAAQAEEQPFFDAHRTKPRPEDIPVPTKTSIKLAQLIEGEYTIDPPGQSL